MKPFIRTLFTCLSILIFTSFSVSIMPFENFFASLSLGGLGGLAFAGALFLLEILFKGLTIRHLNTATLGLLFGYMLGYAILQVGNSVIPLLFSAEIVEIISALVFLFSCYAGLILTVYAADELNFCIPFVRFKSSDLKKKDVILDASLLSDPRLIDLSKSGLLDQQLLIPKFGLEELRINSESQDETVRRGAQNCLEALKKLEALPGFEFRLIGKDFPEAKDAQTKLTRLARDLNAYILTGDISKIQQSEMEGLKVININLLSQALKPLATAGEHIQIKIQRFGKEPRQGVGYLDDGTMVVVNGGAEFIGKIIKVIVLSIKPTTSGRMIFCNALDALYLNGEGEEQLHDLESSQNHYQAV